MDRAENVLYEEFYETFEIVHKTENGIFTMPPHTHNAVEIYLNLTDVPNILLGSNVIPFPKNTLLLIPAYCIHKVIAPESLNYERYILTIHTAWLEHTIGKDFDEKYAYFKDAQNPLVFHVKEEDAKELMNQLSSLIQCNNSDKFKKLQIFFSVLSGIHRMINSNLRTAAEYQNEPAQGTAGLVSAMMNYINTHLRENITVGDVADSLFLNHDYAARIFKKYVNTTVKQFTVLQRVTKAKQLLQERHSVTETQNLLGFNSYEHFFKTFKKVTGMTPKEYRQCYRK